MLDFKIGDKSSWEIIKSFGEPVIIYGMGNGADKIIDILEKEDIPIAGVCASDSFVRGQMFRGFKVKKLSEFPTEYILAPSFGTCIPEVMKHIYEIYNERKLIYPVVPVVGNQIYDEKFISLNEEKINSAYNLFSPKSKIIFAGCINFLFTGDLKYLTEITTEKGEIFKNFLKPEPNRGYLDIGSYKGDTIDEFLKYTDGIYSEILAVEPDEKNMIKLKNKFSSFKNINYIDKVMTNYSGNINFFSYGGRQSAVCNSGKSIECLTVDELCSERNIGYIKTDAEGEEINIISGAEKTLKRCKPKLNTALYHKAEDIFEIPLKIHKINKDYCFEIRHHPYYPCWDTNLYCK